MIKKILKFILGILLFLVAYLLFFPLVFINLLVMLIKGYNCNQFFLDTALSLDIYANREFDILWNVVMKKKGGYSFGVYQETISSALGKNKRDNTLSFVGITLAFILDTLDKNHCIKSIKEF